MINLLKVIIGVCLLLVPAIMVAAIAYFFGLYGLTGCVIVMVYWLLGNTLNNTSNSTDRLAYATGTNTTSPVHSNTVYPEWKTNKLSLVEEVLYENALKALKDPPSVDRLSMIAAFLNARLAKRFDFSNYTRDQLDFCIRQAYNVANSTTNSDYDFSDSLTIE